MDSLSSKDLTQCSCNHSTNFAVLMQVTSDDSSSQALTLITYIGCGTSIAGLLLTLSIYGFLWRMLCSDRTFIHTNLSISILAAQILFIAGINRVEIKVVCKVIAFFLHFFYLSAFGWMLVEGVHLYMKVVKVYGSENIKIYRYVLIGWVAPAAICLISVAVNVEGYGTDRSCWLDTTSGAIWAFVAPALLVITFNMLVLAMVVRIVVHSTKLHQEKQHDHIKAGLKGALVLLPILGMTWLFGMLAFNSATIVFQYLFVIFNSFQGLFIFLIYCVFNSEMKAAFARKRGTRIRALGWGTSSGSTSGHVSKQVTELTYLPSPADGGRKDADESAFNFAEQGIAPPRIEAPLLSSKPKVHCVAINTRTILQETTRIYDPRGLVCFDDDCECVEPTTGNDNFTSLNDGQAPCDPKSGSILTPVLEKTEPERASSLSNSENDAGSTSVSSWSNKLDGIIKAEIRGTPKGGPIPWRYW
ncbi:adhesion G-protein coupled receptor D1-like isoform X2 [Asterias rubens]|uniref:adhesion G-protein coupled receptor D1-like isoform X2 n=1 Tax=Asterias rubens TaxID=7604 RepID=UPI001455592D|nr:adhesion G-protein coupled receptor D1-like isoform X2 [Asterias rubens]